MKSTLTPRDKATHIQTVAIRKYPGYYLKVTRFEIAVNQKLPKNQNEPEE
jgi:hypothetical protein